MQYSKIFFLKEKYFIEDEIIKLQINDDIAKKVANFYNNKPFPNYDDNDNRQSLLHKGNKNQLTCKFKNHVGFSKNILEVGPGTCQVSIYLAIGTNNQIVVFAPAQESLKLGQKFAKLNSLTGENKLKDLL